MTQYDMVGEIAVRGRLRANAPLGQRCWLGVGGAADWLFTPQDDADLVHFLAALPHDIPRYFLGVGSNLLVRDGGIAGVVIRLGRTFTTITHDGTTLTAGAGALDRNVAEYAAAQGLAGCEFLVGIPGTIGGAVRMNAGAYGSDIAAIAQNIVAYDRHGRRHDIDAAQAGFTYRHSALPPDWIVTQATFVCQPDDAQMVTQRMQEMLKQREASQPVRSKTGGSTFENPQGHSAWKLIDEAGCRGLQHGDAQISPKHCNFLINHGNASADDLESLGEAVRASVYEHSGIMLEWEVQRVGRKNGVGN